MSTSAVGLAGPSSVEDGAVALPLPAAGPVVPQPTAAALPKADRLANVERLRVLAMLEIVRYHDHDDRLPLVGGLGLPTFLLLTAIFNCTLTERRGVSKFLTDKRERLFLPWVFWSVVYGAMLLVSAYRHDVDLGSVLSWEMVLAGTNSHLWFVPFAMFSAGLVAGTQVLTRRLPDRLVSYAAAVLGAIILVWFGLLPDVDRMAPIPQWMLSLPSAFFGFTLGRLALANEGRPSASDLLPLAIVAMAGALWFGLATPNMLIWRYCVSLLLVFVVFLVPGKPDALSKFLSPLLFGIYLVHPLVDHRVLVKIPFLEHSQFLFIVDFFVTALLVRAMKFTPLKRFI